jgi:hypothetical protein
MTHLQKLAMKELFYTKAVLLGFVAGFLLENGDVASAQCAPSYYCGPRTDFYPRYYPHDHRPFAWALPPGQLRIPYFNPIAAFRYHRCFDTGHYVVCYPYPAPSYRYY